MLNKGRDHPTLTHLSCRKMQNKKQANAKPHSDTQSGTTSLKGKGVPSHSTASQAAMLRSEKGVLGMSAQPATPTPKGSPNLQEKIDLAIARVHVAVLQTQKFEQYIDAEVRPEAQVHQIFCG